MTNFKSSWDTFNELIISKYSWFQDSWLYKLFRSIQTEEKSVSNILTFSFGSITAVLAIVGLMSIFISINSQHNIEKCREILWSLKSQTNKKYIADNLLLYRDVFQGNNNFTRKVINWANFAIWVVVVSIIFLNLSLLDTFILSNWITIFAISTLINIILIGFTFLLRKLRSISNVSNLPSINELLNANEESYGVNTLLMASYSLRVHLLIQKPIGRVNKMSIGIGYPFPFKNLFLSALTVDLSKGNSSENVILHDSKEEVTKFGGIVEKIDKDSRLIYNWFLLHANEKYDVFDLPKDDAVVILHLILENSNGEKVDIKGRIDLDQEFLEYGDFADNIRTYLDKPFELKIEGFELHNNNFFNQSHWC